MYLCDGKETADLKTILNKTFEKRIVYKATKKSFTYKSLLVLIDYINFA